MSDNDCHNVWLYSILWHFVWLYQTLCYFASISLILIDTRHNLTHCTLHLGTNLIQQWGWHAGADTIWLTQSGCGMGSSICSDSMRSHHMMKFPVTNIHCTVTGIIRCTVTLRCTVFFYLPLHCHLSLYDGDFCCQFTLHCRFIYPLHYTVNRIWWLYRSTLVEVI